MLGNAADDGAVFQPVGNLELQQLLHLGHCLAFKHCTYADIQLFKVFEGDGRLDGVCLVGGGFVCLLGGKQLVYLCLDDVVFYLFEQQFGGAQLMSGRQQVGVSQLCPVKAVHVQHLAKLLAAEGQERFESNGKVGDQLQRDVENGGYALHVCLGKLPRLGVCQVFVSDAGKVHRFLLCVAEFEYVQQLLHFCLDVGKFFQRLAVVVVQFACGGHYAVEVLLGELQGAVHEVAINGNQLVVITCLEVLPGEVVVFCLRCVGGQHVAQHILLAGEVNEILVQPYCPVA